MSDLDLAQPHGLVFVVGRLPPPLDGQTLATARMAELVEAARPVRRLSTSAPEAGGLVPTETRLRPYRVLHYLRGRGALASALAEAPAAPVLWASVSPHPLGHARDLAASLPAFGLRRAVVAVSHRGNFDRLFRSPLTRLTARRMVHRLAAVVFLTDGLADRCAPWIPDAKRVVIPNAIGVDVACAPDEVEAKVRARAPGAPVRLLFLGNMMPEKGYADALEAVRRLHAEGVAVEADFVGRWPSEADRRAFEAAVDAGGLRGRVRAPGGLRDRDRLRALLLGADALLFPSYHPSEALPVAVLEALNAGTPVVGARHSGLPEVVRDGIEGLLVPPRDPPALAAAVRRVTDAAAWPGFARRARARFDAAYSAEVVQARWLDLLAHLDRSPDAQPA